MEGILIAAASIWLLEELVYLAFEVLAPALFALQEIPSAEITLLSLQGLGCFILGQFPSQALAKQLVEDLFEESLPGLEDAHFFGNLQGSCCKERGNILWKSLA